MSFLLSFEELCRQGPRFLKVDRFYALVNSVQI